MGTYRQPTQVLNQNVKAFRDAYVSRRAEVEKMQALKIKQANTQFSKEAKLVKEAKRNIAKVNTDISKQKVKKSKVFAAPNNVATKVITNEDGQTEIVSVTEDQKGLLTKYAFVDKNDLNQNGNTSDIYIDQDYFDSLSEDERASIVDTKVRVYDRPTGNIKEGEDFEAGAFKDVALNDWYFDQMELGVTPFGVGIDGSIELEIQDNFQVMADNVSNPGGSEYSTAKTANETALQLVPIAQGVMKFDATGGEGRGGYQSIYNQETGQLKDLDNPGAIVLRNRSAGGTEGLAVDQEYIDTQDMRISFALDQITGQNKFRTTAQLLPGDLKYTYTNNALGEEPMEIDYKKLSNWIEHRGYGIVETLNVEKAESWMDVATKAVSDNYKNLPIVTESNTWEHNGKVITQKQAHTLYEEADLKSEEDLKTFWASDKFNQSLYAQHTWQYYKGATESHAGTYFSTDNDSQVDWLVEKALEESARNMPPRQVGNKSISYKDIKAKAGSGITTDLYNNKDIEIQATEKFKRDGGKYSLKEILTIQPNLDVSEQATLLRNVKDESNKYEYYSGQELRDMWGSTEISPEAIYKLTPTEVSNMDLTKTLPLNVDPRNASKVIPVTQHKFLDYLRGSMGFTKSKRDQIKKLIKASKSKGDFGTVDELSALDNAALFEQLNLS